MPDAASSGGDVHRLAVQSSVIDVHPFIHPFSLIHDDDDADLYSLKRLHWFVDWLIDHLQQPCRQSLIVHQSSLAASICFQ